MFSDEQEIAEATMAAQAANIHEHWLHSPFPFHLYVCPRDPCVVSIDFVFLQHLSGQVTTERFRLQACVSKNFCLQIFAGHLRTLQHSLLFDEFDS